MKQWNKIYKKYTSYGAPFKHMEELTKLFKKRGFQRVLDLGCGAGKHLNYLAKCGFNVYGIDIAKHGIKIAKKSLEKNNLRANLKVGSIYKKLPYKDNYFDGIISLRVLNHGEIKQIRKIIKEIERVLKPQGLIFTTVHRIITKKKSKIRKINFIKVKMIDHRTYIPLEGREKGIVHYIFNKKLIKKEFKNFKIQNLWVDYGKEKWERYYCLLGELKN